MINTCPQGVGCDCCPLDVRQERENLGLPSCRSLAQPRKLGTMCYSHKTAPELVVGTASTLEELTRNDRRKDRRLNCRT